jgi:hypothetical protein
MTEAEEAYEKGIFSALESEHVAIVNSLKREFEVRVM